jgi:bacteriocin-like protein
MKEKLNLAELSKKELKKTTGGAIRCFCICKWFPDGSTDLDGNQFVIDFT